MSYIDCVHEYVTLVGPIIKTKDGLQSGFNLYRCVCCHQELVYTNEKKYENPCRVLDHEHVELHG